MGWIAQAIDGVQYLFQHCVNLVVVDLFAESLCSLISFAKCPVRQSRSIRSASSTVSKSSVAFRFPSDGPLLPCAVVASWEYFVMVDDTALDRIAVVLPSCV